MEANLNVVEALLRDAGVEASREAKEAINTFAVLYGEKIIRTMMAVRTPGKKISTEDIRLAY